MKRIIERMEARILNYQEENGFESIFDFLNEDLIDLREKTGWISMEDRLPDRIGYYQCYFPSSMAYEEHRSERWFDGKCFKSGSIWTFGSDKSGRDISEYISHWINVGLP